MKGQKLVGHDSLVFYKEKPQKRVILLAWSHSHHFNLGWVWTEMKSNQNTHVYFFCESRTPFMGLVSTDFNKFFFKIRSHSTIHTFNNYFITIFSIFSFQLCISILSVFLIIKFINY